jgi:hypothetical protein
MLVIVYEHNGNALLEYKDRYTTVVCLFLARQPPVSHGLLIHEVSRSHSDTPHSVGLLWTSDQLEAETST